MSHMRIKFEPTREIIDLSGFWYFKIDPEKRGEDEKWYHIWKPALNWDKLYVPANWNEQCGRYEWYMGVAWYVREFYIPIDWEGKIVTLNFEGVIYKTKVWVNDNFLGEHEGGFTPFSFRVDHVLKYGNKNRVVVMVDNTLTKKSIPPGEGMNATYFDFFHYGGIHREVYLSAHSKIFVKDVTIKTDIDGEDGIVEIEILALNEEGRDFSGKINLQILFNEECVYEKDISLFLASKEGKSVKEELKIKKAKFWDIKSPNLYSLQVSIVDKNEVKKDVLVTRFGIRTIKIEGTKILLNGRPIFLKGFGRHEDFPILGKAVSGAVLRRDFDLMKSIGANSFRTSHYPYSRTHLDLADENGFLVILELPTVGIVEKIERLDDPEMIEKAKKMLREMIQRDKNRPSVIMYSLFNEPSSDRKEFLTFLKELVKEARALDGTRPLTFANAMRKPVRGAFDLIDVICQNFYIGWYTHFGDLETTERLLNEALDKLHEEYPNKPIILTEFGAGAISGLHSDPPEMWTEEYQAELIKTYWKVLTSKEYIVGAHIWCFADFRVPQSARRTVLNRKGIFTRDRRPKLAAMVVKDLFTREMKP